MLSTEEKLDIVLRRLDQVERIVRAYVEEEDEWLPTKQAMKKAGIKSRTTLIQCARASAPGIEEEGRITYQKEGTTSVYSKTSCISYRLRKQHHPALAA